MVFYCYDCKLLKRRNTPQWKQVVKSHRKHSTPGNTAGLQVPMLSAASRLTLVPFPLDTSGTKYANGVVPVTRLLSHRIRHSLCPSSTSQPRNHPAAPVKPVAKSSEAKRNCCSSSGTDTSSPKKENPRTEGCKKRPPDHHQTKRSSAKHS